MDQYCQVLVVGAGPAGLTAALYLARFRRRLVVLDEGRSRARYIPVSRNCPGFAHGVSGDDLLAELREQAARHGVAVRRGVVRALTRDAAGFRAITDEGDWRAQRVILATGVMDVLPELPGIEAAIHRGHVRLCAICDAYETAAMRVGVYGPSKEAFHHARYLRSFSASVHALAVPPQHFDGRARMELQRLGVEAVDDISGLVLREKGVEVYRASGECLHFDAFYPVLGAKPRSQLAVALGAECTSGGELKVDDHLRTSIDGLYAIGDVVSALNQIAVAMGHAAIAATAVHNELPHEPLPTDAAPPGNCVSDGPP